MEKISSRQFFGLLILFQIGSYVIFGFATSAKQDAWLVALLGTVFGVLLVTMYLTIYRLYPGQDMVSTLRQVLGKWLGNLLGLSYIMAFIYVAGRVLRDFAELVNSFILPMTPLVLILGCIVFLSYLGLRAGIEVVGRLAEIMLVVFMSVLFLQFLMISTSGVFHFEYLLPVAHQKKEIIKAVIPLGITVPFGETIAFLMFYYQVRTNRLSRLVIVSVICSGVVLAIMNIVAISVLGPHLLPRMVYPLLTAFQQVEIGEFLENIDALAVVYIGIAAFFKITVFVHAAVMGIASVFHLRDYRTPLAPMTILVLLLSYFMARNIAEHAFVGLQWVPWVLWIPLFILVPMLTLVVGWIRKGGTQDAEAQTAQR